MVVATEAPPRPAPSADRAGCRWASVAVWAVYLVASVALHRRVLVEPSAAVGSTSSDSGLFTWWLHWTAWAIGHGENPLYTTWMNAPEGVNGLWNTSVPALGVLLAPITLTAGPLAAFNTGMILGPVVSAGAAYLALGSWTRSTPARAVGGAIVGFGPFVVAHASVGHLNLVWSLMPALVLWATRAVLVEPSRPMRAGLVLGLAFSVQLMLYTQTVALAAVVLVVLVVVLALLRPREVRARVYPVATAVLTAVGTAALLCAYPMWLLLAGPGRPRIPIREVADTGADAANLVIPTALTAVRAGTGPWAEQLRAHLGEQGSYLGPAVLLVVLAGAVLVRDATVRIAAVVTALLAVLSLGTSLTVLGRDTGLPLPWRAVVHVPLVGQAEPGRLAPFVAAGAALVVALLLERTTSRRQWLAVATIALAAATWLPADALGTNRTPVPRFFAEAGGRLTSADIVETWPRASGRWSDGADPLVWQSTAGFAYRQAGGYFIGADADRPLLLEGPVSEYQRGAAGQRADPVRARADLMNRRVTTILVVPGPGFDLPAALRWTSQVTADDGTEEGGVWLFEVR